MKAVLLLIALTTGIVVFSSPAMASPQKRICVIAEVAAFADRMHILCSFPLYGGNLTTRYLAVESGPLATEALTLATFVLGQPKKTLVVLFDDDVSKNPAGCLISDCYRLTGVLTTP